MLRAYGLAVTVVTVLLLAIGAGAPNALATRAPHFHVEGKALLAGEFVEFKTKVANNFVWTAGGVEIECAQVKAKAGATLFGSGAKEPIEEPGTSEETLQFESCIVAKNGLKCKVYDKEGGAEGNITTEPLKNELVYTEKPAEKPVKGTAIGVYYTPVTGGVMAKFFFDAECEKFQGKREMQGSVVAYPMIQGKINLLVSYEENEKEYTAKCTETNTCGFVQFPAATIKTVWRIEKGKPKEMAVKLSLFNEVAGFTGEALINVEKSWGVFVAK